MIEELLQPGLKLLLLADGQLDPTFRSMVQSMVHDMDGNNPTSADNSDKGNTRRNLLSKLDFPSSGTTLSSLKTGFDKALPNWTWKNK